MKNRNMLVRHFAKLGFKIGAEIGVYRGRYSSKLLKGIPNLQLYSVDNWVGEYKESEPLVRASLSRYPGSKIIKGKSVDVAKTIPDNSLDFVYIDADHKYKAALEDILAWTPKVRNGGIVSGHDYQLPDVKRAVDDYIKDKNIELLITKQENIREHPSWWFIKPKIKIADGLNLPGWKVEIPDCGRDELPEFFKEMGFKVGAEIGVYRGGYTEMLCKAGLKLYSIDPWFYPDSPFKNPGEEKNYRRTQQRLKPYDCTIIRKTSMEAVKDFTDGSLDFVYIDANHAFKYIAEDIWEWSKKVKKGGIISGHDYIVRPGDCHVKFVVDAYTKALKINKWYILGRRFAPLGEKKDKERSWFWFNP